MLQGKVILNSRCLDSSTTVFDISGEITSAAESQLTEAYNQATSAGATNVILNLTNLDYMNSSGIGLLVTLLIRTQRQNQRLLAYGLNQHYHQIFELTRLNEAIGIFPSEIEALRFINKKENTGDGFDSSSTMD